MRGFLVWLAVLLGAAPATAAAGERPVRLTVAASGDLLIHTPVAQRALALGGGGVRVGGEECHVGTTPRSLSIPWIMS